eukprot:4731407-Alexandrium_andersonii.AAC.1
MHPRGARPVLGGRPLVKRPGAHCPAVARWSGACPSPSLFAFARCGCACSIVRVRRSPCK